MEQATSKGIINLFQIARFLFVIHSYCLPTLKSIIFFQTCHSFRLYQSYSLFFFSLKLSEIQSVHHEIHDFFFLSRNLIENYCKKYLMDSFRFFLGIHSDFELYSSGRSVIFLNFFLFKAMNDKSFWFIFCR